MIIKNNFLPYTHKEINVEVFIFPITGLLIGDNNSISVGNIDFVDKVYLKDNIKDITLSYIISQSGRYNDIETFAIVDLNKFGDHENLCKGGNNSLALQLLKQVIGAIYLSIYNKYKPQYDIEKRIVISDKGVHEVDEGLNDYIFFNNYEYVNIIKNNAVDLIADINNFYIENISELNTIMKKKLKQRSELESKICKSLEIIYSVYSEPYTVERVIKFSIILNYIFKEYDEQKIDSPDIGRKIRILFNIISKNHILETIPEYMYTKGKKTKKISDVVIDIYTRIRNDIMHGKIDLYEEYAIINLEDYIPLKVIVMELINIIVNTKDIILCKDTKDMNKYIENREKEIADIKRNK